MSDTLTTRHFEFLRSIDTPTVCNLVEMVAPHRRGFGYTVKHLHCPFPDLPPIVGYARPRKSSPRMPCRARSYMGKRMDYLDYIASKPQPGISVIEDIDGEFVGYGAFWGEVQTNVHRGLGLLGVVTNGAFATSQWSPKASRCWPVRSSPSHAYVHLEDFGTPVNIHGMAVKSGDLIHADQHGAVVVPADKVDEMMKANEIDRARGAHHPGRQRSARHVRQGQGRDGVSGAAADGTAWPGLSRARYLLGLVIAFVRWPSIRPPSSGFSSASISASGAGCRLDPSSIWC